MKLLTKKSRSGEKDGKAWEMTTVNLMVNDDIFEVVLFGANGLPGVTAGDNVEPVYELQKDYKTHKVSARVVGIVKAKA